MGKDVEPWERQAGEPEKEYSAFSLYRDSAPPRSADEIYRATRGGTRKSGGWGRWMSEWNWVERVQAYDQHLDQIARKEVERKHKAQLAAREGRRIEQVDREYEVALQLWQRAQDLLALPLIESKTEEEVTKEEVGEDGTTIIQHINATTIIKPLRWQTRDIISFASEAVRILRFCLKMDPPDKVDGRPIKDLTTEQQIEYLLTGYGPDRAPQKGNTEDAERMVTFFRNIQKFLAENAPTDPLVATLQSILNRSIEGRDDSIQPNNENA